MVLSMSGMTMLFVMNGDATGYDMIDDENGVHVMPWFRPDR